MSGARKAVAALVLLAAFQVLAWCAVFMVAAFGRTLMIDPASWASARAFSTAATVVLDGIVIGALACWWALRELGASV